MDRETIELILASMSESLERGHSQRYVFRLAFMGR